MGGRPQVSLNRSELIGRDFLPNRDVILRYIVLGAAVIQLDNRNSAKPGRRRRAEVSGCSANAGFKVPSGRLLLMCGCVFRSVPVRGEAGRA